MPFVVTCEHATNALPPALRGLVPRALLRSHRGWDPGAKELADDLAATLGTKPLHGEVSRLVVDLNRSLGHPRLFGEAVRALPREEQQSLLRRYYVPHWQRVAARLAQARGNKKLVVHLAAHSFVPRLHGVRRKVDIGILCDPARRLERNVALALRRKFAQVLPDLVICLNQPYLGTSDGLPTALRKKLDAQAYVGIELEVNQALVLGRKWSGVREQLVLATARALSF